jgi:hypothetical protein
MNEESSSETDYERPFISRASKEWNKMSDDQRSTFYFLQKRDKLRYEKEMNEYKNNKEIFIIEYSGKGNKVEKKKNPRS